MKTLPTPHHEARHPQAMHNHAPHQVMHVTNSAPRHQLTSAPAVQQAMLGAAIAGQRSVLIPIGISFVTGTLGWLFGGFWWSMAAGAAGYITGEVLRQR